MTVAKNPREGFTMTVTVILAFHSGGTASIFRGRTMDRAVVREPCSRCPLTIG